MSARWLNVNTPATSERKSFQRAIHGNMTSFKQTDHAITCFISARRSCQHASHVGTYAGVDCHYAFRTAQTSCRLILPSAASRLATMSHSGTCRQAHDSRHACSKTKDQCVTLVSPVMIENPQKVTFASHRILTMRYMCAFPRIL